MGNRGDMTSCGSRYWVKLKSDLHQINLTCSSKKCWSNLENRVVRTKLFLLLVGLIFIITSYWVAADQKKYCVCGHVYVVYEDTNLYNDMGIT